MPVELIASPFPDGHVIVNRGAEGGIKIGANKYAELRDATPTDLVPDWLASAVLTQWHVETGDQVIKEAVLVRPDTAYGYAALPEMECR